MFVTHERVLENRYLLHNNRVEDYLKDGLLLLLLCCFTKSTEAAQLELRDSLLKGRFCPIKGFFILCCHPAP